MTNKYSRIVATGLALSLLSLPLSACNKIVTSNEQTASTVCAEFSPRAAALGASDGNGYFGDGNLLEPSLYQTAWRLKIFRDYIPDEIDTAEIKENAIAVLNEPRKTQFDLSEQSRIDQIYQASIILETTGNYNQAELFRDQTAKLVTSKGVSSDLGEKPDMRAAMLAAEIYTFSENEPPVFLFDYIKKNLKKLSINMQVEDINEVGIPLLSAATQLNLIDAKSTAKFIEAWQEKLKDLKNDPSILSSYYWLVQIANSSGNRIEPIDPANFSELRTNGGLYGISGGEFDPQATYYALEIGLLEGQEINSVIGAHATSTGWISPDFEVDLSSTYESNKFISSCGDAPNRSFNVLRGYLEQSEKDLLGIFQICEINKGEKILGDNDTRVIEEALSSLIRESEKLDFRQISQFAIVSDSCGMDMPDQIVANAQLLNVDNADTIFDVQKYSYLGSRFDLPYFTEEAVRSAEKFRLGDLFCATSPCSDAESDILSTAIGQAVSEGKKLNHRELGSLVKNLIQDSPTGDKRVVSPLLSLGLKSIEDSSEDILYELIFLT